MRPALATLAALLIATPTAAASPVSLTRLNDPSLALFPTQREAHVLATVSLDTGDRHVFRLRYRCNGALRIDVLVPEPDAGESRPRYRADAMLVQRFLDSGYVHHSPRHLDVTGADGTLRLRCLADAIRVDSSGYGSDDLAMLADAHWYDGRFANTFARAYTAATPLESDRPTPAAHIRIEAPVASDVDPSTGELRATDFIHLYLTRGPDGLYRLHDGLRWRWLNPPSSTRRNFLLGHGRLYALIQDRPSFRRYHYADIGGWSGNEAPREASEELRFASGSPIVIYSAPDPSSSEGWLMTTYDIGMQTLTTVPVPRPDLEIVPAEPLLVRQSGLPTIGSPVDP